MIRVKATREGKEGKVTASQYVIEAHVPFVALPSVTALNRFVRVQNPVNGKQVTAWVADVGPWNTHDTNYVDLGMRPQAESGISVSGEGTNGAGIDLSEKVWKDLEMADNTVVEWEFFS